MPRRILGLDLGSNSIGWALLEVNEDLSKTIGQIIATGVRIFPEGVDRDKQGGEVSKNESRRIARGMRRQIRRRAGRKKKFRQALITAGLFPSDVTAQQQLMQLDPYELRRRALDEALSPLEFGRALLHLNQRRGFLSNAKTDRERKKEVKGMLAEISQLEKEIQDAGHRTLGEHIAAARAADPLCRIRGKHTRRAMYDQEFELLWKAQHAHHPEALSEELRQELHSILFFQRKMYWRKSAIGKCELEPKLRRCPRADRAAQRFRLLQEVNNLRVMDPDGSERSLSYEERTKLLAYLSTAKERTFNELRDHLGFLETQTFNLEGGKRTKLLGMPTDAVLAHKVFGKEWHKRPDAERTQIVRDLLDLDDAEIMRRGVEAWGLPHEVAARLPDANLPEGYASFSRQAIEKLLPFLDLGLPLMGGDDPNAPSAIVEAGYLRRDQRPMNVVDRLPPPPDLPNPIVRQGLYEVRKLVNAVIREYGKPDAIHVELLREVKGSLEQRSRRSQEMRDREKERDSIRSWIEEQGEAPTRGKIDRVLLWREQGEICVYTAQPISPRQLLGGEVDIDHILPYPRSLDNSLANKVVCFRSANHDKGDRTPYEWLAEQDPNRYERVLHEAAELPYNKRRRFTRKTLELSEFVVRQFVDSAYISRATAQYLRCLGTDMVCPKGQLTHELRWQWGLDTVLRHDDLKIKNREDHRHHAVDAIVVALTNRSRLQQLAKRRKGEEHLEPWTGFRQQVETAVNGINVSHRVRRKVSGELHEKTLYVATKTQHEFVCRKFLNELSVAEVKMIVDAQVQHLITERLKVFGISLDNDKEIPSAVWADPIYVVRRPGRVTRNAAVIKKVRVRKVDQTIQSIRGGSVYVKPGSNHHVCVFTVEDGKRKKKVAFEFCSRLTAANRVRSGERLIRRVHSDLPNARFIMSLSPGELLLGVFKGVEKLVCYRKGKSTDGGRLYFVEHTDARPSKSVQMFDARQSTFSGRKVTVDLIGRIRWAKD